MNIFDIRICKDAIMLLIPWKILLFDLKTLTYICTLEDVDISVNKFTTSLSNNPLVISYGSWSNKGLIKINKLLTHNHQIKKKKQLLIITTFTDIQNIKLSDNELLYVSNKYGNKVHIYSINDYELKYCFYFGHIYFKAINIVFNKKNKYLALTSMNYGILVVDLKHSDSTICQCDDYEDLTEEECVERKPGFFGALVSAIKNTIVGEDFPKYAYYQIKDINRHITTFFSNKKEIVSRY